MEKLNIIYKKISEIKPYKNNPRNNDQAVGAVLESIKEFGFKVPIILDKDNVIISGHTRLKAAKKLKLKEIPCVVAEDLTEKQAKALRLADNKVAEIAEWNLELLEVELQELEEVNFDMSCFGFEEPEILEEPETSEEPEPRKMVFADDFYLEPEIVEELKTKRVFMNFSGGKDSAVTAFLMKPILDEIGKEMELVFVDTGVEIPGTQEYVVRFAAAFGYKLNIVRSGKDFFEHYENKKSFPNAIYRDCIFELINKPSNKFIMEKANGEDFIIVRGGRSNQATNISKGQKIYDVKSGTQRVRLLNPIYDLSEKAFEKYKKQLIETFGIWEGYERGFVRTACWCCPFQRKVQYDVMQKELPFLFDILKRKAQEWDFQGVTPLDLYIKKRFAEVDEVAEEIDTLEVIDDDAVLS